MRSKKKESSIPRKVAFVAMPFGKRSTGFIKEGIPSVIDFDAIWDKAIAPGLEKLGYAAIRADEQSGSVIVKDMLEQLVYADLVIADISVSNANVYYEAGVRHVTKEQGCVLIGAGWAKPVFDLGQIRQIRYPYPDTDTNEIDFDAIKEKVLEGVASISSAKSPIYELTDYPNPLSADRVSSFQVLANELSDFQQTVRVARLKSGDSSKKAVAELVEQFHSSDQNLDSVAMELIALVRDRLGWSEVLTFIEKLPAETRKSLFVQEQLLLAKAKVGEVYESIAALEDLINTFGGTPERYGLLGGRYKSLYYRDDVSSKNQYLDEAILNYQTGMNLDLNEYYCASNLPRLLKSRGRPGDEKKAKFIASFVVEVCNLRIEQNRTDGWARPTLLGAAFDAEDVDEAKAITDGITGETQEDWYLKTTLADLKYSAKLCGSTEAKLKLQSLIGALNNLF